MATSGSSGQMRVVSCASGYTIQSTSGTSMAEGMKLGLRGLFQLFYIPFQCCQRRKVRSFFLSQYLLFSYFDQIR